MDLELDGLRVIVTAGAGGIGREIVRAFIEEGARVHVCDIDAANLNALSADHPRVSATRCDVSDRQQVTRLFNEAIAVLGGLDCLVNNAGVSGPTGRVDRIDPEAWERTMAVNITGQFNCVRLAVPYLLQSANPSIINISSAAGKFGFRLRTPYTASKWAVIGFTKSLAIELGGDQIRANAVLPGIVSGARQEAVLAQKADAQGLSLEEIKAFALSQASIKEMISPRQIADTILCLASHRFSTVSGQAISVDGDLQALT